MQRIFFHLLTLALLISPLTLWAQQQNSQTQNSTTTTAKTSQEPQNYSIDPHHTYVLWFINHMGFSTQVGKFPVSGNLVVDETTPNNSKVNVSIDVSQPVTGIPKLDEHLKGKEFFDVAQFPKATFVSDKMDLTNGKTGTMSGTLTLHGVSKPVTLSVVINNVGISPITQQKTIGFTATTLIKRSDFGINAYLPGLGDSVRLVIGGEANLPK